LAPDRGGLPASTLAEVIDIILDKGLVIDAYVRVSLVGIELLTIDIRVVVASVDTYLHFAEATNRLDLRGQAEEHPPTSDPSMPTPAVAKKPIFWRPGMRSRPR
jgi:hypothetical protein